MHWEIIRFENEIILKGEVVIETSQPGEISMVPYAESSAWQKGFYSPYFKETHFKFRIGCRKIIDEKIRPFC